MHAFSLAEKLWYVDTNAVALVALVVSIDDPVVEDSDAEDELNDQPPTISIQQAIQNLKGVYARFDVNEGTFNEAEIIVMQGLTSKTQSLLAN